MCTCQHNVSCGSHGFDSWISPTPDPSTFFPPLVVYYEAIKRELHRRPMYEYRCDERLKGKVEGSTRLNLNYPHSSHTPQNLEIGGKIGIFFLLFFPVQMVPVQRDLCDLFVLTGDLVVPLLYDPLEALMHDICTPVVLSKHLIFLRKLFIFLSKLFIFHSKLTILTRDGVARACARLRFVLRVEAFTHPTIRPVFCPTVPV